MRIAGVDIGTNTILMVIADYDGKKLEIIQDEHSMARLGQNLNQTGIISVDALQRAIIILEKYKDICKQLKVEKIIAVGTSALRDAKNSNEILNILVKCFDNDIKVISGSEEANLSFLGCVEDDSESLVIDIGGGSTEIVIGKKKQILNNVSLQMGAVRLTEKYLIPHPPALAKISIAISTIKFQLDSITFNYNDCNMYAVAGTPTTLAAISLGLKQYEREKVHLFKLSKDNVDYLVDMFLKLKISEIIEKYNVNPMRADVISAGALILKMVMEKFNKDFVIVSANGLRMGLIKSEIKKVH